MKRQPFNIDEKGRVRMALSGPHSQESKPGQLERARLLVILRMEFMGSAREADCDHSHLSSIEKQAPGDYLIASYPIGAILYINGTAGSIIWQLGGKRNGFTLADGFKLRCMHHVRIRTLS